MLIKEPCGSVYSLLFFLEMAKNPRDSTTCPTPRRRRWRTEEGTATIRTKTVAWETRGVVRGTGCSLATSRMIWSGRPLKTWCERKVMVLGTVLPHVTELLFFLSYQIERAANVCSFFWTYLWRWFGLSSLVWLYVYWVQFAFTRLDTHLVWTEMSVRKGRLSPVLFNGIVSS